MVKIKIDCFLDIAFNFIIYIIFLLAIIGGLSVAPLVGLLMVLFFVKNYKQIQYSLLIRNYKIPFLFLCWAIITLFWTSCKYQSINTLSIIISFLTCGFIFIENSMIIATEYHSIFRILLRSYIGALIIFLFEYLSNGFISKSLRNNTEIFNLFWLDRGCCFLSVCVWPILGYLLYKKNFYSSGILYIATGIMLYLSDSLSGTVAFMFASFAIIVLLITNMVMIYWILSCILIFSIFLLIVLFHKNLLTDIDDISNILPFSAIHRLFIWNFVSEKISKNILIGAGFGISKCISNSITSNDLIVYKKILLNPMPLHPHNNLLQIWLELGLIGLFLYAFIILKLFLNISNITSDEKENKIFSISAIASLINYYIIGLISYNVWQLWWLASMIFVIWMFVLTNNYLQFSSRDSRNKIIENVN